MFGSSMYRVCLLTKSLRILSQRLHHRRISNPTVHQSYESAKDSKEKADLTTGISSLPEAIHMTRVDCFAEGLGVYGLNGCNLIISSSALSLAKAKATACLRIGEERFVVKKGNGGEI